MAAYHGGRDAAYEIGHLLLAFSARLREEPDLERLGEDLVGVVTETMQPAHVSVLMRPDPDLRDNKKRADIRESGHEE